MTPTMREATAEDLRYVLHAWSKMTYGAFKTNCYNERKTAVAYSLYDRLFRTVQKRILARANVVVAVNPDDDTQVLGYIIAAPSLCYFVQVKQDFWGRGIANALVAAAGLSKLAAIVYAFPTPLASVPKPWVFVPWYLHAEIMNHG